MGLTRRDFFRGALAAGAGLGLLGRKARAACSAPALRIRHAKESTTICPYCAVGCGAIVSVRGGEIVNVEGDPDHPINRGSLCSKGSAMYQISNNPRRLKQVLYRAPGSDHWEAKPWRWAIQRIAKLVKQTRDATFKATDDGKVVNRTEGVAGLGGAALDNEECYAYSKLARALGLVYLEHQARI